MKKITLLLMVLFVSSFSFAQNGPINFESGGHGAGWTWAVFENATNPPLEIIANPDQSGINTSATVAKFTALQAGQPWAGTESAHGTTDLVPFVLGTTNSTIKIMVWKSVISDVGIKLVSSTGWALAEIKVSNTVINAWEELTFDFSTFPNPPEGNGQYDQIVIFPDFDLDGRDQDNVIYFDNITFSEALSGNAPPVPAGFVAFNTIGETPVGPGEVFLACGPNQVGGDIVYRLFYSKTAEAPGDPTTATEYDFGSTAGDGDGINAFGFVLGGLEPGTSYSFWLYQYKVSEGLFSEGAATASVVSGGGTATSPTTAAPVPPAREPSDVISVFSGAYSNVEGTDFNPGWGQSTIVTFEDIEGNETLKYSNFNYQGTQFANPLNVTQMETLHLDMWTADATTVNIFCISTGPVETAFSLPVTPGQWVSYDIPLSAFTNVNLADVIQFKFDGGNGSQTIYLDNIYFYKGGSGQPDAPNAPVDFEAGGFGADWTWTVFENDSNPPVEIIGNPDQSGINTSSTVAKFTALQAGQPWAGTESAHGTTDLGPFVLDETNSTIKIMVWKPVISDVGIKLVSPTGWSQGELKVANTLVNQWEELTFDFSAFTNPPQQDGQLDQIVIFPDFDLEGREQDNVIYFDNITFSEAGSSSEGPQVAAPAPVHDEANVISMFSDAYSDVPVDTWRTDWSAAILTDVTIQGNAAKKYANLDFVGIETVANQLDVSGMTHLHLDVWSADFTFFGVKLVDFGPDGAYGGGDDSEHQVNFNAPTQGEWVSLDIPLSSFTGLTAMENLAQYILVGQPTGANTVYIDNMYFYDDGGTVTGPTTAAPTPTQDEEDVISMFSDAYSNVTVDTWRTDWSAAVLEDVEIEGNATKKYSQLDFVGIETVANQLDISGMTHFHLDVWSSDFTFFGVKLVDFGPDGAYGGGDDTEHQVNFASPTQGQWVSMDISLSEFTGLTGRENLAQYILVGQPTGSTTVYVDNVYFYASSTNIHDPATFGRISIYPNPVRSGDLIRFGGDVKHIDLFDSTGRMIRSLNQSRLETTGLNRGIYILRIQTPDGRIQTQKLLVY